MTALRQRMIEDMQVRNLSPNSALPRVEGRGVDGPLVGMMINSGYRID
jgi:hypothetical protein